ncbi:putative transporter [Venturia inaequalis]|nr:putative transporter [Venturia inaequalis]
MATPSLLSIPPELRLKILRCCMVVGILGITTSPSNFRGATSQILRLSKEVHNEALPILYGENIFHFDNGQAMENDLSCINKHAKCMIRHVSLGNAAGLTTKKATLKSLTGLRGFSVFLTKVGMLHLTEPEENMTFAAKNMPPKTVVQDLSRKCRGVEVGVVLCFVDDAEMVLRADLDGRGMVRYRVRLPGKGAEKKEMSLDLDFEGWRNITALMPRMARR